MTPLVEKPTMWTELVYFVTCIITHLWWNSCGIDLGWCYRHWAELCTPFSIDGGLGLSVSGWSAVCLCRVWKLTSCRAERLSDYARFWRLLVAGLVHVVGAQAVWPQHWRAWLIALLPYSVPSLLFGHILTICIQVRCFTCHMQFFTSSGQFR